MRRFTLTSLTVVLVLSTCPGQSAWGGTIVGWGSNDYGQCTVPSGNDFVAVAGGTYHSLALRQDGSVAGWGYNSFGQASPPAGNYFTAIAAGHSYSLALKRDGSILGWGFNGDGSASPPAGNDFTAIAAGDYHSLALRKNGSIVGWGRNDSGQANAPSGNDFVAIAAGGWHSAALKKDGSLVCWGRNNYGQASPPAGNDFAALAAGWSSNLALKKDRSLVAWGYRDAGQTNPPAGNDFSAAAVGLYHCLALRTDGSLVGWGDNRWGQATAPAGNGFTAIACGQGHSLAIKAAAPLVTWPAPFWFLDARIRLVWTPGWITVPTGYWGGWFWWHHQCCWLRPWQGPLQWYWPYCYDYPYTCYWDYWPYYRCYLPWWHYWDWRGWPWFWGFKDCLTYRYWSWKPVIVYWWSYYWFSGGKGYCMELTTMADEDDPGGPKVRPLDEAVVHNLRVQRHQFNINANVEGDFTEFKFIPVVELQHYYESTPGVTKEQVSVFLSSDIVHELMRNDPLRTGTIGVQVASWDHPEPALMLTAESLTLKEGETAQYGVCLPERPPGPTTIRVISFSPQDLEIADADADGVRQLHFDESDWSTPKLVTILAVDNLVSGGKKTVMLANILGSDPNSQVGCPLAVTVLDDEGPGCVQKGQARTPYPEDRAVNVPQDVVLRWTPGSHAVTQHVYFGLDKGVVEAATPASAGIYRGSQSPDQSTFTPGALEWQRSYYWRIDDVNDASAGSPWKGAVWSFTTADFLVVDDFESYDDVEATHTRIWETWIDGYADGSSGSRAGYLDPPFAERTIVHSARQSMPLDYNNVNWPFYSEAYREFSSVQDWTVNGVNTLVLYFQGTPSNSAETLYVAVQDAMNKVVVQRRPNSTNVTAWAKWEIPLSQFSGVNMTKVKKLYVGVGDRDHSMHGGAGRLFIDDIRVTRPGP